MGIKKKIYIEGNKLIIANEGATSPITGNDFVGDVFITQSTEGSTEYTIGGKRITSFSIEFADIRTKANVAYSDQSTWDTTIVQVTGFNAAGGAFDNTANEGRLDVLEATKDFETQILTRAYLEGEAFQHTDGINYRTKVGGAAIGETPTTDPVKFEKIDTPDNEDIIPLFLIDQVGPSTLASVTVDGNYCIRNVPTDLVAQGITGHTVGDILRHTNSVWTFILSPVAGVTKAILENNMVDHVFMDDPEGNSPLFSETLVDGQAFSLFALATDLTGVTGFDGTTITGNKTGGLVVADFNNAAALVVSAIIPYWIENTISSEESGVFNITSNDAGTGDYTLRRDYRFRDSTNFTDGQTFFIASGDLPERNAVIALDQQFAINTDPLRIKFGKLSDSIGAATVATEEFAHTDNRYFGELGLPGSQTGWTESGTGVISIVSDDVLGTTKDVVKHFSTTGNTTKSETPITASDWTNVLTFGASFSGTTRITEDISTNSIFAGMGFSPANDPRPTSVEARVGVFISVDATHTTVRLDGQTVVTLDGAGGNPLVLKDEWFKWDAFIKPTPDAGVNFGAVDFYVNGVIVVTGGIIASNNAVSDEISLANSSSSGQTTFYIDDFGATILEESTTKTLAVSSLSTDVVQVITPPLRRDFEVLIPDGSGRPLGAAISLVLNNVGGTFTIRAFDLGSPQSLINGLHSFTTNIISVKEFPMINTVANGNVYSGTFVTHTEMTTTERLALVNPKRALIVFDITLDKFFGYDGNDWVPLQVNADGSIDFGVLSGVDHKEGRVYYDNEDKALNLKTDIVGSTQSIGQEFWVRVINKTEATITDGEAVYISGFDATSGRPTIALAKADTVATADAVGFATSTMIDDAEGFVTTMGFLNDLNTSSFTNGDRIYLSDTVAGGITATEPILSVPMGFITNANASGQLFTTISRNVSFGRASGVLHNSVVVPVGTTTISLTYDTNPSENPLKKVELVGGLGGSEIKSLIEEDIVLNLEPQFNRTSGGVEESITLWSERSTDDGASWVKELAIEEQLKGGDTRVAPLTAILCCKNDRIRFRAQGTTATTLEFVAKAAGTVTSDHPIIPAYILTIA